MKEAPAWQNPTEEELTIIRNLSSSKVSENERNIFPPVIFCRAAAVHHAAGHVLAVARIALHHHGGWLEDRHGDLCHGQLLMVCLLCRDDWCIGGQHEVDAWVWHQVGLEPWLQSQIIQSSNDPIQTQSMWQRLRTNPPKLEVTKQHNWKWLNSMCFGARNSVMSTFNAPSNRNEAVLNSGSRRERGWKDVRKLLTPRKLQGYMLLERGAMRRWSGQSTCSSWCKLDARCPSSCGKYRRGPRCPEKMATRSRRGAITTTTTRRRRRTTTTRTRTITYTTS